jgi:CubicO group peptidase (beta-lactamase class C family)
VLDPSLVTEIETLIEETMEESKIPGFAIGIVKDGQPVYSKGFGVAELGSDKPVTPQSLFHVASTGKTVVAMAIMQLVEQGLIELDDPVTDYLPYFSMADEAYTDITIRHLLAHRAGLPGTEDAIIRFQTMEPRYDEAALEDYVRSMSEYELLFAPGEDYSYSSPGFDVLGDVVAKVSGQSFEEYVDEHIFAPLGMEDSTFLLKEANPELLTVPHMYDEDGNAEMIDFYPYDRRKAPSDGLYTSVDNLIRMAMAHLNEGELDGNLVLSSGAYDEMWTPYSETGWAEWFGPTWSHYGLGWLMGEADGHMVYNHTGADSGYQSHLLIVPDEDLAIVTLVNVFDRDEGSFHAYAIGNAVMEILLGMKE